MSAKDEAYIIDLCDRILGERAARQYRGFDFLAGDTGRRLPVDAYYERHKLVIEYHERQHTEAVPHFDKPSRVTCSGIPRGEQRRRYDDRRRTLLPANGLTLVVLDYSMFSCDGRKRLRRSPDDESVIREYLSKLLK